jgi:hypothetical protein
MPLQGADPESLDTLGRTLKQQIDAISGVMSTVSSVLGGTVWEGPAHDRFVGDWNGTFRSALGKLNDAFGAAGQDCLNRSQALRAAMGG